MNPNTISETLAASPGIANVKHDAENESFTFSLNGKSGQAFARRGAWKVMVTVGKLDTDPGKLDAIYDLIASENAKEAKAFAPAKLIESDCYLYVESAIPEAQLQAPQDVTRLVTTAAGLLGTPAGGRVLDAFPNLG
ncbi:MAG: hypothetical protein JNM17_35860 [Archangium sp.]|nr:hypothetical protein [Archangium sp.]